MPKRFAFTLIELVFVIVIMGIIGKFGVEFLAQAYKSYIYEKINHTLQTNSGMAVEQIAKRLEYRIKDSVIARTSKTAAPKPINDASGENYIVLEWIGYDNEGFRGITKPYWSGIIDLNQSSASILFSPDTNTSQINTLIKTLSSNDSNISNAALYFIGSNSDVITDYGWDGNLTKINAQQAAIHPIKNVPGQINQFQSSIAGVNFSGVDIYEYYQLVWTAYAIVYEAGTNNKGTLRLYWNYQPWEGESISDAANSAILMENVSTFQFVSIGSIIKIQVCTKSDLLEEYSLCKEKTIM